MQRSPSATQRLEVGQQMTDASEAGRALAAHRKRAMYTCVICGAEFEQRQAGGKRTPLVCRQPRCINKRREQTRKPKP